MSEGRRPLHVPERPNSWDICLQPEVDSNVAVFVGLDSRLIQTEIVRVGAASDGGEQVRSGNRHWPVRARERNFDRAPGMFHLSGKHIQVELDAFRFENFLKLGGDLRVL